jgi:hypothetical protein
VKKKEVVAGKKLTYLRFEILKIGHQEAEIRRCKFESGDDPGEFAGRRRTSKSKRK